MSKIGTMASYTVGRDKPLSTSSVRWTEDIEIEWGGPSGLCMVAAAFNYEAADVRLLVRRSVDTCILAAGLGDRYMYSGMHPLNEEDVVVLQWRARLPTRTACSTTANLTITKASFRAR